jgi:hypothetical protein
VALRCCYAAVIRRSSYPVTIGVKKAAMSSAAPGMMSMGARVEGRHRHTEVGFDRRADPVRTVSEVRAVQVHRKDLIFRMSCFEPACEAGFTVLLPERARRRGSIHQFRELFGDRAAALDDASRGDVCDERAHDAFDVDACMCEEARVFIGDGCSLDHRGDSAVRNSLAVLKEKRRENVRKTAAGARRSIVPMPGVFPLGPMGEQVRQP